jgi:hypothetical protein
VELRGGGVRLTHMAEMLPAAPSSASLTPYLRFRTRID